MTWHSVTIFWDANISVGKAVDASGQLLNEAPPGRLRKFPGELVWMAQVLRAARAEVALDAAPKVACSMCGTPMKDQRREVG